MNSCAICLGNLNGTRRQKTISACKHGFHKECLNQWAQNRKNCPMCRGPTSLMNIVPRSVANLPLGPARKYVYGSPNKNNKKNNNTGSNVKGTYFNRKSGRFRTLNQINNQNTLKSIIKNFNKRIKNVNKRLQELVNHERTHMILWNLNIDPYNRREWASVYRQKEAALNTLEKLKKQKNNIQKKLNNSSGPGPIQTAKTKKRRTTPYSRKLKHT